MTQIVAFDREMGIRFISDFGVSLPRFQKPSVFEYFGSRIQGDE